MNQELWNKILVFDFDNPQSEYGFSTRLAHENFWTEEFTNQAILEYKKFMYLAVISDSMVSPSKTIDIVWHQHLIFTQSYQEFCSILGKQIQHIPSTHHKSDFEKFRQAKERTANYYQDVFGQRPESIWEIEGMFESLQLAKANFKVRTFVAFGVLIFIWVSIPAYYFLRPIYMQINNPYFINCLLAITVLVLCSLELYNTQRLKKIVSEFAPSSFVFNLHPYELVYLQRQKISDVINGAVSELVDNGTIQVNANKTIELVKRDSALNKSQFQVVTVLSELDSSLYFPVQKALSTKPIFLNIQSSMDAFRKYFNKSKKFGKLFQVNFVVLSILILISFTRIITGISRDKPVFKILMITFILIIISAFFLNRLTKRIATSIIPTLYKKEIVPQSHNKDNWQWKYFLVGTSALAASFYPLVNVSNTTQTTTSSCGTSCGSSCGSSCSSCGG